MWWSKLAALTVCGAAVATAQGPPASESGLGAAALWGRRPYYGLDAGLGLRPAGQVRFTVTVGAGVRDGRPAGRVGGEAQFLVLPAAKSGVSPYVGMGVTCLMADSRHSFGALTLTVGVEAAEGNRFGWYAEGGASGGARLAVGVRWRRFPAWWR
ncbi:MAG TPA: hypothetical protein VJS20_02360 [Gemmatimonadales bacterium]|nr:hypothetical protein [Gemmatimonadales bacterium]